MTDRTIIGYIDLPVVETTWSTASFAITTENLKEAKVSNLAEYVTNVRNRSIDIWNLDPDWETHDSEIVDVLYKEATAVDKL